MRACLYFYLENPAVPLTFMHRLAKSAAALAFAARAGGTAGGPGGRPEPAWHTIMPQIDPPGGWMDGRADG